ncbi:MAG: HDIG domain-containing metalloprotein, partial [Candidatus Zixiibacteriota bacterium]
MFALLIKLKRALRKIFRVQSEARQRPAPTLRSRVIKLGLVVIVCLLVGILYPGEQIFDPLDMPRQGEVAPVDIIAPFRIIVHKTEQEIEEDREDAVLSVPYVLVEDTVETGRVLGDLNGFLSLVDSLVRIADTPLTELKPALEQIVVEHYPFVNREAIRAALEQRDVTLVRQRLQQIYTGVLYRVGIVADQEPIRQAPGRSVLVRRGEREKIHPEELVFDPSVAYARLLTELNNLPDGDSIDINFHYLVGRQFIRPNLRLNPAEYQSRVTQTLGGVGPIKDTIQSGDLIVRRNVIVTEEQARDLQELARVKREQLEQLGWTAMAGPVAVRILLISTAFVALYLFLFFFRQDIYRSNAKVLALLLVFAVQLLLVYLASNWGLSIYLYPVALLPMMVTILFDAEIGVLSTIVFALLVGILHRFNFSLSLVVFTVGVVSCFVSRRVRQRSHFARIMFAVAIAYAVVVFLVESLKLVPTQDVWSEVGYGVVNGIVCGFLTIGLLPFFESIFGITTDITLLELSDLNNPLLKRLALEAPGTFQHSLNVGNLAEAGAKAISANSLLARVGTYYHDIGKIEIPEYFVENQLSVKSKHEQLTPSMSAIILTAHVKKGRQLGEEAGLPDDVLNFIEEHHGTMVMSYFYDKALKQGADSAT